MLGELPALVVQGKPWFVDPARSFQPFQNLSLASGREPAIDPLGDRCHVDDPLTQIQRKQLAQLIEREVLAPEGADHDLDQGEILQDRNQAWQRAQALVGLGWVRVEYPVDI